MVATNEYRPDFTAWKSHVCHRVKREGDVKFLINVLSDGEVLKLWQKEWFPEALYLLATVDYLSRLHDVPSVSDYDDLRKAKMEETIYPIGVVTLSVFFNSDEPREESRKNAIPEFLRHNIVEGDIRDVC
jgi:hypothetical protein